MVNKRGSVLSRKPFKKDRVIYSNQTMSLSLNFPIKDVIHGYQREVQEKSRPPTAGEQKSGPETSVPIKTVLDNEIRKKDSANPEPVGGTPYRMNAGGWKWELCNTKPESEITQLCPNESNYNIIYSSHHLLEWNIKIIALKMLLVCIICATDKLMTSFSKSIGRANRLHLSFPFEVYFYL